VRVIIYARTIIVVRMCRIVTTSSSRARTHTYLYGIHIYTSKLVYIRRCFATTDGGGVLYYGRIVCKTRVSSVYILHKSPSATPYPTYYWKNSHAFSTSLHLCLRFVYIYTLTRNRSKNDRTFTILCRPSPSNVRGSSRIEKPNR